METPFSKAEVSTVPLQPDTDLVRGGWNETVLGASQETLLTSYCLFFVLISELKCHKRSKNKVSANRFCIEETRAVPLKKGAV